MWCCSSSAKFLMDSFLGTGEAVTISSENNPGPSDKNKSEVKIDNGYIGNEVVVVKGGLRICGTGGALGSAPLVQTKSYFEVKLQQEGTWAVGVATRNCGLDTGPYGNDPDSWVLRNSGELWFNGMTIGKIDHPLEEGDVIGVSFDHIELNFYVNGKKGNIAFSNVRGTVFPALCVGEGAVLDAVFDSFLHPIPSGFDKIIKEKSLL